MSTREQIEQLEKELAELRDKERVECEEARKKAAEERDSDLLALMAKVKAFNEKYDESMVLRDNRKEILNSLFPFLGDD